MPELPEVETIARDLRAHLVGARILAAHVIKPDILRRIGRTGFERGLAGRRIEAVGRRAKHLVVALEGGRRLVVQPRMTGAFLVDARAVRDPYTAFELRLDTGKRLRYRDVRRLGAVFLLTPRQWADYDRAIGPEPLAPDFTAERFAEALGRGSLAVKKALMDQRRLAGVGNIYANEALWLAGIDPSRRVARLTRFELDRLHSAVLDVLARAIEGRGTTIRDYRTGTGEPGGFQGRLTVYGREREACLRCGRRIVLTQALDARATYFCPGCQH
ncbi:MAG: DNA-formamidopyrimidine glycosylase [Gemmatimonadetes bacterium GWC2_71_9]|nr:MAG: DNA-formamidopyrimidine glycosylase [Gemmatimonadetes bacterium GWC2_71_9]OGT97129.1 MAG: DNA-formamidopyrimidine glycosylase [Gemmatimonadetes bacterium RIFCSPLOWO2_02_FULL_71_11]